jgi:hypothetical protein
MRVGGMAAFVSGITKTGGVYPKKNHEWWLGPLREDEHVPRNRSTGLILTPHGRGTRLKS